jgi:hypothetical protein
MAYTKADFETLALFVAIADELSHEPFLSEDIHETVYNADSKDPLRPPHGVFAHPALLKSAAATFRKLWLRDHYDWVAICELIAKNSADIKRRNAARVELESYSAELTKKAMAQWSELTISQVFNLWFNTQIFHAGPKNARKTKAQPYSLEDFDAELNKLGRAKFEYMFRARLRMVGKNILFRCHDFVFPEYWALRKEGHELSFKAEMALRHNPYPSPETGISIDDWFWHLNRETSEETFFRLLERQAYGPLCSFFRGYFENSKQAHAAACHFSSFEELLTKTEAIHLKPNDSLPNDAEFRSSFSAQEYLGHTGDMIKIFKGHKVLFDARSYEVIAKSYLSFRETFFAERSNQRASYKRDIW